MSSGNIRPVIAEGTSDRGIAGCQIQGIEFGDPDSIRKLPIIQHRPPPCRLHLRPTRLPALSRERQVGKFSGDSAKGGKCDKSVMFATHEIPVSKVNEFISNKMNEMITFNNFN